MKLMTKEQSKKPELRLRSTTELCFLAVLLPPLATV